MRLLIGRGFEENRGKHGKCLEMTSKGVRLL